MESKTSSEQIVYIYPKRKYFHCVYGCGCLKPPEAIEMKESEAISKGYKKCSVCFYRYPIPEKLITTSLSLDLCVETVSSVEKIPDDLLKESKNMEFHLLLDDVRVRIAMSKKNRKDIFEIVRIENIRKEIISLLKPAKQFILNECIFFSSQKKYLTDDIHWKFALFKSIYLEWDQYIRILHKLFPDGLFHDFSFEDAVFVLFLHHSQPGYLRRVFSSEKYKSELKFYVGCLAGAIKKWIEVVRHVHVPDPRHPVKGNTLPEKIYNTYWALYDEEGTPINQIDGKAKED